MIVIDGEERFSYRVEVDVEFSLELLFEPFYLAS